MGRHNERSAMMNDAQSLPNWLAHRAAVLPNQPALLADGARWTFAELDRWASAMACGLLSRGVAPGDRVALLLRNNPEFVALAHAAARAGVTLVPLNTRLAAPELAWQLADSGARLLIYDADTAALAEQAIGFGPAIEIAPVGHSADRPPARTVWVTPSAQADEQPQLLRRDLGRWPTVDIASLRDSTDSKAAL